MKRDILNSPRLSELKKHRRRAFQNKVLIFVFGFLVVSAFLIYISRLPTLNIDNIIVVGNKVVETEMIKEVAEKELAGKYFFVFPKTNIFLYSKNNIEKELHNKFNRLKNITFAIKNRKILEVSVTERVALYTWCGVVPPTKIDTVPENNTDISNCYFLDNEGYIFEEAPYFSGQVYFKFYGKGEFGSNFLPDIFQKLTLLKKTLEDIGLKAVAIYKEENGDVRMFFSNKNTSVGPEIIFKADSDFQKVAENLEAALTTEPLQSNLKNKYSSLLYIDLRFGNKVYYKFR